MVYAIREQFLSTAFAIERLMFRKILVLVVPMVLSYRTQATDMLSSGVKTE